MLLLSCKRANYLSFLCYERCGAVVEDRLVTNGGRVLAVTGVASTLQEAVGKAYQAVAAISFDCEAGAHFRKDIAKQAL